LADLDQQIHDYRPDVTAERIQDIREALSPTEVDFASLNHRNSATSINACARAVLSNGSLNREFPGVSCLSYQPRANARDRRIRQAVGILNERIKDDTGEEPANIAILSSWGKGVRIVSNALRGNNQQPGIAHRVQFDETATYLSSRLIAFMMEPAANEEQATLLQGLQLMRNLERAKGNHAEVLKYDRWCASLEDGSIPNRGKVMPEFLKITSAIQHSHFSGNPEQDWTFVRSLLLESEAGPIKAIGRQAEYLMAFNRGRLISAGLTRRWQEAGDYRGARGVLDSAINEAQMGHDVQPNRGIHVMTTYKAKGKEFDGVILFQNNHSAPFALPGDSQDYARSRKLLFVGISRARKHVMLLRDVTQTCPITGSYAI
jgi:DNA helicase-2/ATP-dependent DNA helicase PcrA